MSSLENVRVAVYGTGNFANRTRIPNLKQCESVELVAVCDANLEAAAATAEAFEISKTYQDGHQMLEREEFDVLYSLVPAFARTDVEACAASKGIHIFSEKPQAIKMEVANRIDRAIREAGVLSTVGFRERYRPIFQEAKRILSDKRIVHVRFQRFSGVPGPPPGEGESWWSYMEKGGYSAFDWGGHAIDYARFMTGLDIVKAQAFYHHPEEFQQPLSTSFHFLLSNGGTMTMGFISAGGTRQEPYYAIFFEGGCLSVYQYDRIEINDEVVYQGEEFDPWLEQDKTFIEAVRTGGGSILQSDYHDGLYSLAPLLAGWESAKREGECIDLGSFMKD